MDQKDDGSAGSLSGLSIEINRACFHVLEN
jgi:hypothetical protein